MAHFQDTAARPSSPLLSRTARSLPLTLLLTVIVLMAGTEVGTAQTQDGMAILLKTLKMYQSFTTYSGKANVNTLMLDTSGQTIKHIGSASLMKFERPNKIFLSFQTPIGSRQIYSDGKNFSVYDATPNQYLTVPSANNMGGLLQLLLTKADVADGLDPLFFLAESKLPAELTNVKIKASATFNGHPVYVITGMTNVKPVVIRSGNTVTTIPTAYWTWWIDRNSSLLYKIETRTPNIVKPVSFGSGATRTIKAIKGTLLLTHTVSEIKPDANLKPEEFVFHQPPNAIPKKTIQDVLPPKKDNKGK